MINFSKDDYVTASEANLKNKNSQGKDESKILHNASNLASETTQSENSIDVLKKQLEKLQKRLKEIESAIKQASASQNPYAKEIAAPLQTQKGSIFAQIMQINAQLLQMQSSQG